MKKYFRRKIILLSFFCCLVVYSLGLHQYFLTLSFDTYYNNLELASKFQSELQAAKKGIEYFSPSFTYFPHKYIYNPKEKCHSIDTIDLLIVVVSAISKFDVRQTIRKSWGQESQVKDFNIRRVFLVGVDFDQPEIQDKLDKEARYFGDIVQGNFKECYYNLTMKTMMGFNWTFENCANSEHFLFVNDDYYVSISNVIKFLRYPAKYPSSSVEKLSNGFKDELYSGYLFKNMLPDRWYFSKWFVSIDEYPYSRFPPYIAGGAKILSRKSLVDIYYGSLLTKYFVFEDVFVGMAAWKSGVKPLHEPHLRRYRFLHLPYSVENYKDVIASHGFDDPEELNEIWSQQYHAGYA